MIYRIISKNLLAISALIFIFGSLPSFTQAQPYDYCKFETKEGAQCPAAGYAGNQTVYPNENCTGTVGENQACCCTKKPDDIKTTPIEVKSEPLMPKLQVSIPGLTKFSASKCENGFCETPWMSEYIKAIYNYSLIIIGLLAVIVMMIGGVLWLSSAGNEERITQGKGFIKGGVFGVTIAVCSYMILFIINPNLTILPPIKVAYLGKEDLPDITEYETLIEENNNGETTKGNFKTGPKNIKSIDVETTKGLMKIQVDETIVEATQKAFKDMKAIGFDVKSISDYRPASHHCHSVGLAIDINANENYCVDCYGEKGAKVLGKDSFYRPLDGPGAGKDYTGSSLSMQKKVIELWTNAGWCWGGNWRNIKDYMHFSAPTCTKGSECGLSTKYDFTKSVKENNEKLGITYP